MSNWRTGWAVPLAAVAVLAAAPAAAQFSEGYKFIKAVKDKDGAAATKLLDTAGSTVVNARDGESGDTALHIVTRQRNLEWIGFLLQHGANVDLRDRDGATPLLLAATTGNAEAVRIFLLVHAQVDAANRLGETPLMKAVQARDPVSARALLEAGADPDHTDNTGNSPRKAALADTRGGPVPRLLKDAAARKSAPQQGPVL